MITYVSSTSKSDLLGILKLQSANHKINLSEDEIKKQGFVTIKHSYSVLKSMNDIEKHSIAKENNNVIAYILAMTKKSKEDVPYLIPLFDMFDSIKYKNKLISEYNYLIIGQVCVDKNFRSIGVFDKLYEHYKNHFKNKYSLALTSIAMENMRSINAHLRIGFIIVHKFKSNENTDWCVVLWDWNNL